MRSPSQEYLLKMISSFETPVGATQLVKAIFLDEARENRQKPFYQFYRWYYGPYSKEIAKDIEVLVEHGDIARDRKGDSLVYYSKHSSTEFVQLAKAIATDTKKSLKPFLERLYEAFGIKNFEMGEAIHFDSNTKSQAIDFINQLK